MAQIARGHVSDRPFARTVYTIAVKRFTGDLVMTQGPQQYTVTWRDGWVVAAASPSPADTPGRIALTSGLVTSTQLSQALAQAEASGADPLDVLARSARLTPEQVEWVGRQTLAHCALRMFSLADGQFSLDDRPSLAPRAHAAPLHPCWVIYHGLRKFYDEARLAAELAALGAAPFRLSEQGAARLADFGLDGEAAACAATFRAAAVTLPELLDTARIARAAVMSLVYALLAADCLDVDAAQMPRTLSGQGARPAPSGQGARPAGHSGQGARPSAQGARAAGPSGQGARPDLRSGQGASPAARSDQDAQLAMGPSQGAHPAQSPAGARTDSRSGQGAASAGGASASAAAPGEVRGQPLPRSGAHAVKVSVAAKNLAAGPRGSRDDLRQLVEAKLREIEQGADHFGVLGIARGAADADVRNAYFALARQLHPDQLRRHGVTDNPADAQRVMAQINLAFGVLSNRRKRAAYEAELDAAVAIAGGDQAGAEAQAERLLGAERHFRQGEMALRRSQLAQAVAEFRRAAELNPDEAEHHALLGWAKWCAAEDKKRVRGEVQALLRRAQSLSPSNPIVYLYRGKVASQSGDVDQAIECFRQVLELSPGHGEASLELRVLESRRDDKNRGLLDRLKRK